jgi:hypothetical protein
MTLYLVAANNHDGDNMDLFVMADDPVEAVELMLAYYDITRDDLDMVTYNGVRVWAVPMPFTKGAIEWPDGVCVP